MGLQLQKGGIYTIPNFFTSDECNLYLQMPCTQPTTSFTDTGVFDNKKWVNSALATTFFTKLQNLIEPTPLATRANTVIMTGSYTPGQQFNLHTDTGLYYNRDTNEKSSWTLLIYLNDDFEGGHTLFYDSEWTLTNTVCPQKGKALLFDIDLWHRGDVLTSGTKHWIGCEIIGKNVINKNKNK